MEKTKKKVDFRTAGAAARDLMWLHRHRLYLGLALIAISRLCGFVLPASSKLLIDEVIGNKRTELFIPIAVAAGVATIIQALTSFSLTRLLGVAAQRAINDMRMSLQQHVIRLPVSYYDSTKSGELVSRVMTDAEGIRNLVGSGVTQLVGGSLTAIVGLSVLFYVSWQLTTITIVALILFGAVMSLMFKRVRPLFRQRGELNARASGHLVEMFSGIRIVKAYTSEKREDGVFGEHVDELYHNVAKTMTATSASVAGATALFGGVSVLIMVFGGRAILAGTMTLGDLLMYIFVTGLVTMPMIQISNIATQMTEALAGLDRIRELRQMATEEDADASREPVETLKGDIRFEDVWFEYEEDVPVLKGISFDAEAGTTTALVGSSGSGKSTIIGMVMAFNRPKAGRIVVDGGDLSQLRLYDYREHLGIVMQDNFLFDGTIAENIAYAKTEASREDVERAAAIAHCGAFVDGFENGYDTVVGERGVKLSGGQRQRVAIARAILADPNILILDEATSSLDSESEALIQDGLNTLRQGRTTFVIAHRLSTIRSADQILVVEDGQILERGSHEELFEAEGRYRDLYDKQYKLERNRFINPGEDFTPEPEEELAAGRASR